MAAPQHITGRRYAQSLFERNLFGGGIMGMAKLVQLWGCLFSVTFRAIHKKRTEQESGFKYQRIVVSRFHNIILFLKVNNQLFQVRRDGSMILSSTSLVSSSAISTLAPPNSAFRSCVMAATGLQLAVSTLSCLRGLGDQERQGSGFLLPGLVI